MQCLLPNDSHYPSSLQQYRYTSPLPDLWFIGNLAILEQKTLALFCSVKCPGDLILQTYDLAQSLRNAGITVMSGFHSPMEKECFTFLLRGTQPIIHCPARGLEKMRIAPERKTALDQNRLLLLSPFPGKVRRPTTEIAQRRNKFITALADAVFIAYAAPGSKTEALARQILAWDKPLLTFDHPENEFLLALGAKAIQPDKVDPVSLLIS